MKKIMLIAVMAIIGLRANAQSSALPKSEVITVHGIYDHTANGEVYFHIVENNKIVPVQRGHLYFTEVVNGNLPEPAAKQIACYSVPKYDRKDRLKSYKEVYIYDGQ